jgi:hypothetical protein
MAEITKWYMKRTPTTIVMELPAPVKESDIDKAISDIRKKLREEIGYAPDRLSYNEIDNLAHQVSAYLVTVQDHLQQMKDLLARLHESIPKA